MTFLGNIFLAIILISLIFSLVPVMLVLWARRKLRANQRSVEKEERKRKQGVYISSDTSSKEKVVEKDMGQYVDYETVKEE